MDVSADWLSAPPDAEEEPKRFYGVVTGRVINLIDIMQLGRVQVQLPFIDDLDLSPWARIATPMSGVLSGMAFLPQIGDEVLVAFEHGDVRAPYVIGSLWNGFAPPLPNLPVPDSPVRTSYSIRTLTGNQLIMIEAPPTIELTSTLAAQSITMTNAGTTLLSATSVEIAVAGATIIVTPAGIAISGANVSITAGATLSLAAQAISLTATAACTITGATVLINP